LTFKLDSIPLVFAANWYVGDTSWSMGLTGDYWALNKPLTNVGSNTMNWFLGVGFFANMNFTNDDVLFTGGMRVPFGLNMFLADGFFEPFIQVAPSFGIHFVPSLGADKIFFPLSAGFRMWFK